MSTKFSRRPQVSERAIVLARMAQDRAYATYADNLAASAYVGRHRVAA